MSDDKPDGSPTTKSTSFAVPRESGPSWLEREGIDLHPEGAALLRMPLPEHMPQHRLDAINAAAAVAAAALATLTARPAGS